MSAQAAEIPDVTVLAVGGRITFEALAILLKKERAKSPTRAARDWCKSRGVTYKRDGHTCWVVLEDVNRAINGLPTVGRGPAANDTRAESADDALRKLGVR